MANKGKVNGDGWSYDQIQEMIAIATSPLIERIERLEKAVDLLLKLEVVEVVKYDGLEVEGKGTLRDSLGMGK